MNFIYKNIYYIIFNVYYIMISYIIYNFIYIFIKIHTHAYMYTHTPDLINTMLGPELPLWEDI